jgi:hypothetical protein
LGGIRLPGKTRIAKTRAAGGFEFVQPSPEHGRVNHAGKVMNHAGNNESFTALFEDDNLDGG